MSPTQPSLIETSLTDEWVSRKFENKKATIRIGTLFSGIGAGGFGVNHADLGPKYTGSLYGIAGSIGMIAAIISPIITGFLLEIFESWAIIFQLCSLVLAIGGTTYLFFASAEKQFD